jgi:hypothetical protein
MTAGPERSHRELQVLFVGLMLGMLLPAMTMTIVSTALPAIVSDLGGLSELPWVVTAYLVTATISGPLYGKLSDLFGRRPILLFGIGIFLVGSALAGLSQEMWHLIAARGIQGLGAGALFPIALAVIGDLFADILLRRRVEPHCKRVASSVEIDSHLVHNSSPCFRRLVRYAVTTKYRSPFVGAQTTHRYVVPTRR